VSLLVAREALSQRLNLNSHQLAGGGGGGGVV